MRSDVTLRPLEEKVLRDLLDAAVADADPREVMPPLDAGPDGGPADEWTPERRSAFLGFHRTRSLTAEPVEATYAVVVGKAVVGAVRLFPLTAAERAARPAAEAGVWLMRSYRGAGVGDAAFRQLLGLAHAQGIERLYVHTTVENTAARALITALGATVVRGGGAGGAAVTAWLDTTGSGS
ncbi:MAG TPA: GNAT family N-acetyltransferase [Streptomyces sp.]|nr:GNAT family N-acetyltransferase [Streptomyces sp.]